MARKILSPKWKKTAGAWTFLLPNLLGVAYFTLIPMLRVLLNSFQQAVGGRWVGLQNYRTVLSNPAFQIAVSNTARFTMVCIPILLGVSLLLALLFYVLGQKAGNLTTVFLLPMAVPAASVVLVWKTLFHEKGLINCVLETLGAEGVNWMNSGAAFWMLVISYLWKNLGYTIVLWMAGLTTIPPVIYEAAQVDGATAGQTFRYVTLPNLKPAAYTITVVSVLNSFKVFREAWLVGGDYPHESMYLLQHLYNNWFRELDYDKIAAACVMTSAVVFLLIGLLRRAWDKEV